MFDLPQALRPSSTGRPERSISHLLSRLVLSIMIPLIAFSAIVLWRFTAVQQRRAETEALLVATALASDIDREIRGIVAALTGLSTSPALQSDELAVFYDQASQVAALIGSPILLRDGKSGQQLLNTRRPFGATLPGADASPITETVVATKALYVSDLVFGAVAQRYLMAIAVPVMRNGTVRSVLIASIEPRRLAALMADQRMSPDWVSAISDRKGLIIARSREAARFVGQQGNLVAESTGAQGVHRVKNLEGTDVLRGYRRTEHGWLVAAFTPMRSITGPLRESWLAFLAIGIVVLGLTLPLTLHLAGRISHSIRGVADRAAALERGEVVPLLKTDIREAAEVAELLNASSIKLRERTRLLAESAARFRSAFDQAAVGFEQTDLEGRWLSLNNRFCQLLGYTREECLELSSSQLTHPEDRLVEAPILERVLNGNLPNASIEKRYFKKGGDVVWVRSTTSLVRDPEGKPLYFVAVVEDISSDQNARAVTARLAALVQASNDAIISITPDGLIDTWNPGAERLFGYSQSEILGRDAVILGASATSTEGRTVLNRGFGGEAFRVETQVRRKDTTLLDVAISVSPISSTGKSATALSVTIEDISQRRQWERQLILLNRELQHRVKNSLAVVQSIANQTMRSSKTTEGFRTAFQGRLQALAAANDLLLQSVWTGSDLASIIDLQMTPLLSEPAVQLRTRGPAVALPAELTVPLGLALHELGTNALKYGSLSVAGGHIDIDWTVEPGETHRGLVLTWAERGGPPATPTEYRGFGSTLITRGIPRAIVDHRYTAEGVVCTITIALENLPAEDAILMEAM